MKKIFLIGAGGVSLSLGIIGIFVPVLPTTPFLLLSAYCFLKSSSRLHGWLVNHKLFGAYIRNYLRYHAITLRAKIISLILLWAVILTTVIFFIDPLWLDIVLVLVAVGVPEGYFNQMKPAKTQRGEIKTGVSQRTTFHGILLDLRTT